MNRCESLSTSESPKNSGEVEKRAKKRKFCHHCNDFVSSSTFYRHRALFFDEVSQSWKGTRKLVNLLL